MRAEHVQTSEVYATACEWWEAHKWPVLPLKMLPPKAFVVKGVAIAWLYKTDSAIWWMEWLITNPISDKQQRADAIAILLDKIELYAMGQGVSVLFTSTKHKGLLEKLGKKGWVESEKDMTHLIRRV